MFEILIILYLLCIPINIVICDSDNLFENKNYVDIFVTSILFFLLAPLVTLSKIIVR